MDFRLLSYLLVIFNIFTFGLAFKFEEITSEIFPDDNGVLAAYGHFDKDEYTDVITLQKNGNKLQLLKGSENHPYFQSSLNCSFGFGEVITSVVPSDFNGDNFLDILITLYREGANEVKILWGNSSDSVECKTESLFTLTTQPFVADFNGDMIPDIIGELKNGNRTVWISSHEKIFRNFTLNEVYDKKLRDPHSSGLIDFNHDLRSDILMTGRDEIEVWLNTGRNFVFNDTIPYPERSVYKWQSTYVDINLDGEQDHIMPICYDRQCLKSAVMMWKANDSEWITLLDDFTNPIDKTIWSFRLPGLGSALEKAALPTTLRFGDVDMDGYTDFLVVLQSKSSATDMKAVILKNVPCETCIFGRTLEIIWNVPGLSDVKNIQLASFFDLFEDGILDILVSSNKDGQWKVQAFKNTEIFDSCFLKVLVLSGLCYDCSTEPYGVNQPGPPGPLVRFKMAKQDGQPIVSTAIQLSQSAHFPLQLPYSMFGLGSTPDFIDVLTISVPVNFSHALHQRDWVQIIPNSQIVVIPHPPYDSSKWVKKLFVNPSRLVLLTCLSLIGTCLFISLIVAALHWKERREDKKERMQDAHRFHFDAM